MRLFKVKSLYGTDMLLNLDEVQTVKRWCGKDDEVNISFKGSNNTEQIKASTDDFQTLSDMAVRGKSLKEIQDWIDSMYLKRYEQGVKND